MLVLERKEWLDQNRPHHRALLRTARNAHGKLPHRKTSHKSEAWIPGITCQGKKCCTNAHFFFFLWLTKSHSSLSLLSEGGFSINTFFFFWLPSDWSQALVCLPPIAFKLIIFNIFGTADYTQTWPVSVRASHMLWNNHWLGQFKSNFLHSWSQFSTSDYSQHDLNYIIKAHIQINFSKHEQLGLKHSGSHKIWYAGIFSRLSKLGYSKILWNDFKTAHKTLIFWFAVNRVTLVSPINTCICLFFSVLQKQINLI